MTSELPDNSARFFALAWLDGVVVNTGDPLDDAAVWMLTHKSWRCQIATACVGSAEADAGLTEDVRTLEGGRDLARYAVLQMRAALPMTMQDAAIGDAVGLTQLAIAESVDRVLVVVNDTGFEAGWHNVTTSTRIGFGLTMAYDPDGRWTVAGIEQDCYWPAWLSEIDADSAEKCK
jgi:hypothetical protein